MLKLQQMYVELVWLADNLIYLKCIIGVKFGSFSTQTLLNFVDYASKDKLTVINKYDMLNKSKLKEWRMN